MKACLFLLVVLVANSSCNNGVDVKNVDRIDYSFHDASVAPEYNRSYTISITPSQLVVTIKSYSDILHTETRPLTPEQFDKARRNFSGVKQGGSMKESEIPVGGSSESFRLLEGGKEMFYGEDYGASKRNFAGIDDISLTYLVPDISALIEATRNKK